MTEPYAAQYLARKTCQSTVWLACAILRSPNLLYGSFTEIICYDEVMIKEQLIPQGLQTAEVAERTAAGLVNDTREQTSRSLGDIIKTNVLTRLNAIVAIMTVAVLSVGSLIDASFGLAAFFNSVIGIFQEVRAKRTLDRLAIVHAPVATVIRDGKAQTIPAQTIVQDDVIKLQSGDQISVDGITLSGQGLEINESLLTGEADALAKERDDKLMAGSFVVAGEGYMRATAVGVQTYAHSITKQAKRFTIARSELVEGTNTLLKYIMWIVLASAPLIVGGQIILSDVYWKEALVRSIAAIDGMIPQGLVLLTSLAFMLATVALARRKVLIQQLPAVEGLARVDTICLDKTGTLTEGTIVFESQHFFDETKRDDAARALASFAYQPNSPTLQAVHDAFALSGSAMSYVVPFSSARKWSAVMADEQNYWIIGAPEMVWRTESDAVRKKADAFAETGRRVLLVAHTASRPTAERLPTDLRAVSLIVLQEKIRDDAQETLAFFHKQGVALKIISGDNPRTVQAIAQTIGVRGSAVDARTLPADIASLATLLEKHSVFGRVTPDQKQLMVKALQSKGHVVAMTGDGVNDVLALKDADVGIAMGNGAQATKAIAELVLLDNKFSRMPRVLAEGRRVIANIERVASFFVIKNVYSFILALSVTAIALPYPFLPRHLTILSTLTIGIPAFFLSLSPNNRRYVQGFLRRVLGFAIPSGLIIAGVLFANYFLMSDDGTPQAVSTTSSIIVMAIGTWIIMLLARPLRAWKMTMAVLLCAAFAVLLAVPSLRTLVDFTLEGQHIARALLLGAVGIVGIGFVWRQSSLSAQRQSR